jgi:hypothetical protein
MNDRQQIDDLVETLRNVEPAEGMVIQEQLEGAGAGARP